MPVGRCLFFLLRVHIFSPDSRQAEEFLDGLYEAADLAAEEDGPQAYAPMLAEDIRGMEELREAGTYQEIAECL